MCDDAVVELVISIVFNIRVKAVFENLYLPKNCLLFIKTMSIFLPHPFNFRIVICVHYSFTTLFAFLDLSCLKFLKTLMSAVFVNDFKYVIVSHRERNSRYIFSYLHTLFRNGYKCQHLSKAL